MYYLMIALDAIFSGILTLLIGVVAFFLKQLLADFKKAEKELVEVKNTVNLIQAEIKGNTDLINQRTSFLETRVSRIEKVIFKIEKHENGHH